MTLFNTMGIGGARVGIKRLDAHANQAVAPLW